MIHRSPLRRLHREAHALRDVLRLRLVRRLQDALIVRHRQSLNQRVGLTALPARLLNRQRLLEDQVNVTLPPVLVLLVTFVSDIGCEALVRKALWGSAVDFGG